MSDDDGNGNDNTPMKDICTGHNLSMAKNIDQIKNL